MRTVSEAVPIGCFTAHPQTWFKRYKKKPVSFPGRKRRELHCAILSNCTQIWAGIDAQNLFRPQLPLGDPRKLTRFCSQHLGDFQHLRVFSGVGGQKRSSNKRPLPQRKGYFWKVQPPNVVEISNCLITQRKALYHLHLPASTLCDSGGLCPGPQTVTCLSPQMAGCLQASLGQGERGAGEGTADHPGISSVSILLPTFLPLPLPGLPALSCCGGHSEVLGRPHCPSQLGQLAGSHACLVLGDTSDNPTFFFRAPVWARVWNKKARQGAASRLKLGDPARPCPWVSGRPDSYSITRSSKQCVGTCKGRRGRIRGG